MIVILRTINDKLRVFLSNTEKPKLYGYGYFEHVLKPWQNDLIESEFNSNKDMSYINADIVIVIKPQHIGMCCCMLCS